MINPTILGTIDTKFGIADFVLNKNKNILFIANFEKGFTLVNVKERNKPTLIKNI